MARIHFGTNGVRGVVGEKLTADFALSLGRAATAGCAKRPGRLDTCSIEAAMTGRCTPSARSGSSRW